MTWKKARQVIFDDEQFTTHLFLNACDMNEINIVKKHILRGVDVNAQDDDYRSGLHIAADNNYYNLVKILLQHRDININVQNNWGVTPLYQACARNHMNIVILLLENKADINLANKNGYTPLHNAVLLRYCNLVKILLEKKAKLHGINIFGKTPLYFSVVDSPSRCISELLVKYGADVDLNNGLTMPILLEISLNCQSTIELNEIMHFVGFGGDINIQDKLTGRTALHIVAITNYVPLAEFLVGSGANLQIEDIEKKIPLDIAIRHRNTDMIRFLKNMQMMRK